MGHKAEIGRRTKYWREKRKLSQDGLARKAGVSFYTVRVLETNRVTPNLGTVVAIAKALDVSVGDLLDDDFSDEATA